MTLQEKSKNEDLVGNAKMERNHPLQPVRTKAFLQPSTTAAMYFSPSTVVHKNTTIPAPFLILRSALHSADVS